MQGRVGDDGMGTGVLWEDGAEGRGGVDAAVEEEACL